MNQSPLIRPACPEDLPRIKEIALRAWEPIYAGYQDRMGDELFSLLWPAGWEEAKANEIADHFQRYPEQCLVTELDGRIVGFITFVLKRKQKIGEIGNNAVDPDYQGRGIGVAQYRHVLQLFRKHGMAYAEVGTGLDEAHAPARAAYEKVGFTLMIPIGRYYRKL